MNKFFFTKFLIFSCFLNIIFTADEEIIFDENSVLIELNSFENNNTEEGARKNKLLNLTDKNKNIFTSNSNLANGFFYKILKNYLKEKITFSKIFKFTVLAGVPTFLYFSKKEEIQKDPKQSGNLVNFYFFIKNIFTTNKEKNNQDQKILNDDEKKEIMKNDLYNFIAECKEIGKEGKDKILEIIKKEKDLINSIFEEKKEPFIKNNFTKIDFLNLVKDTQVLNNDEKNKIIKILEEKNKSEINLFNPIEINLKKENFDMNFNQKDLQIIKEEKNLINEIYLNKDKEKEKNNFIEKILKNEKINKDLNFYFLNENIKNIIFNVLSKEKANKLSELMEREDLKNLEKIYTFSENKLKIYFCEKNYSFELDEKNELIVKNATKVVNIEIK